MVSEQITVEKAIEMLTGATIREARFYEAYCSGEPCETIVLVTNKGEISITATGSEGACLDFRRVKG